MSSEDELDTFNEFDTFMENYTPKQPKEDFYNFLTSLQNKKYEFTCDDISTIFANCEDDEKYVKFSKYSNSSELNELRDIIFDRQKESVILKKWINKVIFDNIIIKTTKISTFDEANLFLKVGGKIRKLNDLGFKVEENVQHYFDLLDMNFNYEFTEDDRAFIKELIEKGIICDNFYDSFPEWDIQDIP